jgi:hypothetical protein
MCAWSLCSCSPEEGQRARGSARDPNRPGLAPLAGSGGVVDGRVALMPVVSRCAPDCPDFPREPIFDVSGGSAPPSDAASLFGAPDNFSEGVCVLEPHLSEGKRPGALFPRNWLRPRFRWKPAAGEDLWEIRLTSDEQAADLVAYTTRSSWTLPREIWKGLTEHTAGAPITVTIRGVQRNARKKPSGARGSFAIAPTEARGKLVYWATTSSEVKPDASKLVGFAVGDERVADALRVPQVGDRGVLMQGGRELRGRYDDPKGVPAGHVQCIGCHVSTPDGEAVAFTDHWPWNAVLASVQAGSAGQQPAYLTSGAQRLLNQPWLGMTTFSAAHWSPADRILVASYSPRNPERGGVGFSDSVPYPSRRDGLAWFDLEAMVTFSTDPARGDVQQQLNDQVAAQSGKAFGLLALDGETRAAVTPNFSHDGRRIVYTSADATQDGRIGANNQEVDLHSVPWNERAGGTVMPVKGAAERGFAEYYPAFSPDDRLIAFNRAKLDGAPIYYRPDGEVYLVPGEGGEALRLRANDPPTCSGEKSPGIINSWPKWSPSVALVAARSDEFDVARTYYWVIFSSARQYEGQFTLARTQYSPNDTRSSQLYMAAVVRDESTKELETFPAVYLWNQDPATSNLTPAWDDWKLPPIPGPE